MNAAAPLLEVRDVVKAFPKGDGASLLVLDKVNLTVREGEIVGLLGRSGSGKSSLLRLIAGLSKPTTGEVSYLGHSVDGPAEGVSMVFQSFALFPGSRCSRTSRSASRRSASRPRRSAAARWPRST
jgi:NitT/TauT family transport system ATP-binding protein